MKPWIIFDTDIDTDCDDAGALAVLHALANRGEAELLGVVCSVPVDACATCVAAINAAGGRPTLPVGLIRIPDWATNPAHEPYRRGREHVRRHLYNESVGEPWRRAHPEWQPEEAVHLYRRLLAAAPDRSVTICAVGMLSAVAQFLDSPPDALSPLPGLELVRRKVDHLVTMALGRFPAGRDTFNWVMDIPAAASTLNRWPTRLTVSEWGETIQTGARLMAAAPEGHALREAYRIYLGGTDRNRSSWDHVAAIWAVRAPTELFTPRPGFRLRFDAASGNHRWDPAAAGDPPQFSLERKADDATLARYIEDLMIESLRPA